MPKAKPSKMRPARTKAGTTCSRRPRELLLLRLRRTRWADCDICRSLSSERTKLQSQRMHIAKLHQTEAALVELDQTALAEAAEISASRLLDQIDREVQHRFPTHHRRLGGPR